MGIYKFGNNTYSRCIIRRSNLGHIFQGEKSASYGPGNKVIITKPMTMDELDKCFYTLKRVKIFLRNTI